MRFGHGLSGKVIAAATCSYDALFVHFALGMLPDISQYDIVATMVFEAVEGIRCVCEL